LLPTENATAAAVRRASGTGLAELNLKSHQVQQSRHGQAFDPGVKIIILDLETTMAFTGMERIPLD